MVDYINRRSTAIDSSRQSREPSIMHANTYGDLLPVCMAALHRRFDGQSLGSSSGELGYAV